MWQTLIRSWLLGAAVALAAPDATSRADPIAAADEIAGGNESEGGGRHMSNKSPNGFPSIPASLPSGNFLPTRSARH